MTRVSAVKDELRRGLRAPYLLLAFACFALTVLGVSYLDEDAFISFRVVDNFVNGHGLRWNIDERVQVFTHPLWVLLLIPLHALFGDIAPASYVLSWVLSCAAFLVVATRLVSRPKLLFVAFLLPLLVSQSFTDYTSSGLENPLVFFLLALLARCAFTEACSLRTVTLLGAFAAISRPDTPLMFVPLASWMLLRTPWKTAWKDVCLGALPLLTWMGFSLFYYGIVFPNPKYAKLNGGIDRSVYFEHGWAYVLDILRNDTSTWLVLASAPLLAALVLIIRARKTTPVGWLPRLDDEHTLRATLLLLGVALYSAYVFWIGGDFMAGRHWAAPFFLAVATLALWLERRPAARDDHTVLALLAALLFARFALQPVLAQRNVIQERGQGRFAMVRSGEIRVQRFNCGFFEALFAPRGSPKDHEWSKMGLQAKKRAEKHHKQHPGENYVVDFSAAGKPPFFAGPGVTYVDALGIVDPLLARLPDSDGKLRIIGHVRRDIPAGYLRARRTGDDSRMHPALAQYYRHLRVLTSAPLLAPERLTGIIDWTLGRSDVHLQHYVSDTERQVAIAREKKKAERPKKKRKRKPKQN